MALMCLWYSWLCMLKVAPCTYGRKSKFFWLDGLLTISYNYGAMLCALRVPLQAYWLHACKCAPLLGTGLRRNSRFSDQDSIKQ